MRTIWIHYQLNYSNDKTDTNNLLKIIKFVPKNNFLILILRLCAKYLLHRILVLPFTFIFMDRVETQFREGVSLKTWVCLRYIDDTFCTDLWWRKTQKYLVSLIDYHPNPYFTHEESWKQLSVLEITVNVDGEKFARDLFWKITDLHE